VKRVLACKAMKRSGGFSLAEVAVSSFLVILLAIFTADICLLIFGCSVNDKACRDVVRAAAQQPTAQKALLFAQASVANHKTDGFFISPITLVNGVNYQDFAGNPPPGQTPYVQVITQVTVTLPAPLYFFGQSFTNVVQFKQIYTSPIIKTKYVLP
jgi:hypothetical protein